MKRTWELRNTTKFQSENLIVNDDLGDAGIDWRIIIKFILNN